jgi:hypothetical protein
VRCRPRPARHNLWPGMQYTEPRAPRGDYIDLADPNLRAWAIANGLVWAGPQAAKAAACDDIVAGRVPVPDSIPPEWLAYIHGLPGGERIEPPPPDGSSTPSPPPAPGSGAEPSSVPIAGPVRPPDGTSQTFRRHAFTRTFPPIADADNAASALIYARTMTGPLGEVAKRVLAIPGRLSRQPEGRAEFEKVAVALASLRYAGEWRTLADSDDDPAVRSAIADYLSAFAGRLGEYLTFCELGMFGPKPGTDQIFRWGGAIGALGELWGSGPDVVSPQTLLERVWSLRGARPSLHEESGTSSETRPLADVDPAERRGRLAAEIHACFGQYCDPRRDAVIAQAAVAQAVHRTDHHLMGAIRLMRAPTPEDVAAECRALWIARYGRFWLDLAGGHGMEDVLDAEITAYLRAFIPALGAQFQAHQAFRPAGVPIDEECVAWIEAIGVLGGPWHEGRSRGEPPERMYAALWQFAVPNRSRPNHAGKV